jgi:hypothetical protein
LILISAEFSVVASVSTENSAEIKLHPGSSFSSQISFKSKSSQSSKGTKIRNRPIYTSTAILQLKYIASAQIKLIRSGNVNHLIHK